MEETMMILKAAADMLDQQTGLSFHGPPTIAHLMLEPSESSLITSHENNDALADFADYCLDTMEPTSSEPMVSFIKRFQNRSRETGPAEPCKHVACSQNHPVNECCICRDPRFVHRCWHVLGLPEGSSAAIKDNFVKQHAANDVQMDPGKEMAQISAIPGTMLRLKEIRTDQEYPLFISKIQAHQMVSKLIRQ
jgi:hypothetical protein